VRLPAISNSSGDKTDCSVEIVTGYADDGFADAPVTTKKPCKSGYCLEANLSVPIRSQDVDKVCYDVGNAKVLCAHRSQARPCSTTWRTDATLTARSQLCSDSVCFMRVFCRVDNVVARRTLDPQADSDRLKLLHCNVITASLTAKIAASVVPVKLDDPTKTRSKMIVLRYGDT
jgi:hypothetical protein